MTGPEHPEPLTAAFDPVIHPTHRLRICAALEPWDDYEFSDLRKVVGVSDSVLSKQLAILMDAKYVTQARALREGRQRVSLRLTDRGRAAFRGHVRALRDIVGSWDETSSAAPHTLPLDSGGREPSPVQESAGTIPTR